MNITQILNKIHENKDSTIGVPNFLQNHGKHLVPSVNFSSAHSFSNNFEILEYHTNKYNSLRYNRDSKEIVFQLENYFRLIFNKNHSLILDSGMRAITVAINALLSDTSKIFIPNEIYRKTREYCEYLVQIGAIKELCFYDNKTLDIKGLNEKSLIIIESFSNPHLIITNFDKVKFYKEKSRCKVILDSTFSGLSNHKAELKFVDIEVQSLTKYTGGYNDIVAGVIATNNKKIFKGCWDIRSREGGILDSMSGYLLIRSLRSYDLRRERQKENSFLVHDFLKKSQMISNIFFPGKQKDKEQNELFNKYYQDSGSVISFVSNMQSEELMEILKNFNSIKIAPSFGSIDTLIEVPSIMSHFDKDGEYLKKIGLEKKLIRLSIGCEPIDMIIKDLKKLV